MRRRRALRLARDDRRRGPRPLRPVGADARIRRALDAALGAGRLGAVHAPATGPGCARGAGPGSTTRPGASRRSTTAAGSTTATPGAGRRAPTSPGRSTRRRWWRGSAARAPTSRSRSAARRAGRLVPARAARGLRAGLPGQPALRAQRQRHPRHQRHQHHDDRQQPQRRGRPARLREPQVPACGDLRAGRRDDAPRSRSARRRRATATIRRCARWSPTRASRRRC